MARRRTQPLTSEQKKQARKIRRELKKSRAIEGIKVRGSVEIERTPEEDNQFWSGIRGRMRAEKTLNNYRDRAYWLSIPANGVPPISGFFPCTHFKHRDRIYYGFLFREHRDRVFIGWSKVRRVRKELTGLGQAPHF